MAHYSPSLTGLYVLTFQSTHITKISDSAAPRALATTMSNITTANVNTDTTIKEMRLSKD